VGKLLLIFYANGIVVGVTSYNAGREWAMPLWQSIVQQMNEYRLSFKADKKIR